MAIASPPRIQPNYGYDDEGYLVSDGLPMAETDKHADLMVYAKEGLRVYFADRADEVYVSGNNFVHYRDGDRSAHISPDCYVVFGVEQRQRDNYKIWEEGGHELAAVFEFTSRKTRREDVETKRPLYENVLRVPEYFLFDPTGDYLKPRFQGFRLREGRYEPIPPVSGRMFSEVLKLELVQEGETLRFYDPVRQEWILTPLEQAQRARQAESENARLRAELEALRRELAKTAEDESR